MLHVTSQNIYEQNQSYSAHKIPIFMIKSIDYVWSTEMPLKTPILGVRYQALGQCSVSEMTGRSHWLKCLPAHTYCSVSPSLFHVVRT